MANATINDLPIKSGSLVGTEMIEVDDGASKSVTAQQIADLAAAKRGSPVTALAITAGVVNIDCSLGDYFTLALTGNVTGITFSNLPAAGVGRTLMVRVKQDSSGARTMALPASFKAVSGSDTAIQTAANSYTILAITSFDQGARWEYSMKGLAA